MRFGFVPPGGDAREASELAREAEAHGWDGFFVCEPVWGFDAWVSLAAAAINTSKIRLGTMLSPLSRMRPWKLASETVSLDHLSKGRLILSVGLGAIETGFEEFGEIVDRKARSELVDKALDILQGLWKGQPFNHKGKHYNVRETKFFPPPPPIQTPRIPIWVVGAWKKTKSMRRALKFDGLLPTVIDPQKGARQANSNEVSEIKSYVMKNVKGPSAYDIIIEGKTPGADRDKAAEIIRVWESAGATWWIETLWEAGGRLDWFKITRERIRQGPPREPVS